jgi:hypothetical protein
MVQRLKKSVTSWSNFLLEKLIVARLVKKYNALRNLMMHYRVHKTPTMVPVMFVPLRPYVFRIHLFTIVSSVCVQRSFRFSGQTFICISRTSYACYPILLVLITLIMIFNILKNVNPEYLTHFT